MSATVALSASEARLYLREWGMLVYSFVFPPMMMLILAGVFSGDGDDEAFGALEGSDFYIASYVGVPLAAVALTSLPVMLASYRELGVLKRFAAAGIGPGRVVLAQTAVAVGSLAIGCVEVILVAAPVFGVPAVHDPLGVLAVLVVGAGALLTIGIALGLAMSTVRSANALGNLIFLPMFILGGGGPPPGVMPEVMRNVADLLPLTHVAEGLRTAWLTDTSWTGSLPPLLCWWAVAALAVVLLVRRRSAG